jgi:hypothetical protein
VTDYTSGSTSPLPQSPDESQFKPQTYDEWKAAHGWQPETPHLERGQVIIATVDIYGLTSDTPKVPEGTQGHVIGRVDVDTYNIEFDNGITCELRWYWGYELGCIEPVGKSPSQLAHEQSERERLTAWQQLSLFEAVQS